MVITILRPDFSTTLRFGRNDKGELGFARDDGGSYGASVEMTKSVEEYIAN